MAITMQRADGTIIYSLGNEKVLTATFESNEKIILKIDGAIKTLVAPCFEEVIKEAISLDKDLIIDLSNVTYIASAGLRVLLDMQQEIDENESPDVVLVNIQDPIKEVFEQTGFINILNIQE